MNRTFNIKTDGFNPIADFMSTRINQAQLPYNRQGVFNQPSLTYVEQKSASLKNTIIGFVELKQNWDSYNADPISKEAIKSALSVYEHLKNSTLLPGITTHIFPMRDGGIQYEFDSNDLTAELEISPDGELLYLLYDSNGELIDKIEVYDEFELIYLLKQKENVGV